MSRLRLWRYGRRRSRCATNNGAAGAEDVQHTVQLDAPALVVSRPPGARSRLELRASRRVWTNLYTGSSGYRKKKNKKRVRPDENSAHWPDFVLIPRAPQSAADRARRLGRSRVWPAKGLLARVRLQPDFLVDTVVRFGYSWCCKVGIVKYGSTE